MTLSAFEMFISVRRSGSSSVEALRDGPRLIQLRKYADADRPGS